ncbi:MAG: IS4 family transposase, partial [Patescibacteria group bacterium]
TEARKLYVNDKIFNLELDGTVYVIDSTTIELCLNLFPWARLKKVRAAVKLNLAMELKGNIPAFFQISEGKAHDIHFLDFLEFEAGAYYVLDRGYVDFKRLYKIHQAGAFFVTRAKDNFSFKRLYSNPVDKSKGIICDQVIRLRSYQPAKDYPEKFRRIKFYDFETNHTYVFLTNNFNLPAVTVALLYKYRWQIELFFKWIKQHLSIESFWGRSENAVKTQICIALCAYLLVAILKKNLSIKRNSYEILQILSVSLFDKTPIVKLVSKFKLPKAEAQTQKQAQLWDD